MFTFALVRVWTPDSTLAKLPFPREPVMTYRPIHLTCFDEPELLVLPCEEGGRGTGSSLGFDP